MMGYVCGGAANPDLVMTDIRSSRDPESLFSLRKRLVTQVVRYHAMVMITEMMTLRERC